MRITKLFSKLRLVKNWQSKRGKREALSTENREHFRLYVICNNNFPLKISNPTTFLNFLYLKKLSVKRVFCPTIIFEGLP